MEVVDESSDVLTRIQLQHLPDFFRQGHAGNQVGNPLIYGQFGVLVRENFSHCTSLVEEGWEASRRGKIDVRNGNLSIV